ncbi:hypothetical protein [uncultured Gammaproteobacteria bacterium]|jgi:tetratricopeptide (TPR) repeat protein|nr:hypothetical protein [uncultured Gammaproteobacteria bacterium]CAC9621748.1 hypothetical protein [uncultured Gammaproteobacteria bacterium]
MVLEIKFYKISFALGILIFLTACISNPLNEATYYRYLKTGYNAEKQMDTLTAEIAYSRALGNVYMGNLGSEKKSEALFNLGRLERINGKLDASLKHLLKSLKIDEKTNKSNDLFIKSTLAEIAKTYYEKGLYMEGEKYLNRLRGLGVSSFRSEQSKKFIQKIISQYADKAQK